MNPITLLIDADDTLWDDGKYFTEAIHLFQETMQEFDLLPEDVEKIFRQCNERRRLIVGYGAYAFADAMIDTLEIMVSGHAPGIRHRLELIGSDLIHHPVFCFDGVEDSLDVLTGLAHLIMVTQGDPRYQQRKIDDSGVSRYFDQIEIVAEKKTGTFRDLMRKHRLDPSLTWMIGNSPACDMNPALEAGCNAIYLPNQYTWKGDLVPIKSPYVELQKFGELPAYFRRFRTDLLRNSSR